MKRYVTVAVFAVVLATLSLTVPAAAGSLGAGIHYLKTVGDIKDSAGWDKNALGFIGSYQHGAGLVKLEGDVEYINDYGGSDHSMIEPQAYALLGNRLYGGAGIGIGYIDNGWQDAPFYALRAGYALGLTSLTLDGFASYRFQNAAALQGATSENLDTITFGLIARF